MTASFDNAATTVSALAENADRLGLTWGMRPATVVSYDWDSNTAFATYDGDDTPIGMVSLAGPLLAGFRVMVMAVPPSANFIVSTLGIPESGTLAIRLRVTSNQTVTTGGTGAFVNFGSAEHNFFGTGFVVGTPDRYVPPLEGVWRFNGWLVWAANATSRRGAFLNKNGLTGITLGAQSLQTPAAGSCQIQCSGAAYFNGTTDYVGLRGIQNSGVSLDLDSAADGGSVLEGYYVGPFLFRAS